MIDIRKSVRPRLLYILRLVQKLRQRSLVVSPIEQPMPGAFIVGAPRSGTTLLRYILDSHSAIAAPPETFLFEPLTECLRQEHTMEALWHLGFQRDAVGMAIGTSARMLLEGYAKSKDKRLWVEKTPANLFVLPEIANCLPGAKFIMLYRHPFDVINSQYTSGWVRTAITIRKRRNHQDDDFLACCKFTADCYRHMGQFARMKGSSLFQVRYEDIVADPVKSITALCAFLGVPFEEQMLSFQERPHDSGFGDVNIRLSTGIEDRRKRYDAWDERQLATASTVLEEAKEFLPYEIVSAEAAK